MKRFYKRLVEEHLRSYRQMLFLMGPRQVGKTTLASELLLEWELARYFNWDDQADQQVILGGTAQVAEEAMLRKHSEEHPLIIFDEIHKYRRWKLFLKGLYDAYPDKADILVTGSARLDVYQRGGDSLMGRYFSYRIHPFSVAELANPEEYAEDIRPHPKRIDEALFQALWRFGGFPDPLTKGEERFFLRWQKTRYRQLFREDIRELTQVQELQQLELLAELLRLQVGQLSSYASLARKVRISDQTVRKWLKILAATYYCFEVRPWSKNVARSLIKEPKYYLWDWSLVDDEGQRAENFVASHLLKAVHFWNDHGLGDYCLHYIRDKEKREVDFLVTKNRSPFLLVEVKKHDGRTLSPSLQFFRAQLQPNYTFQVVIDLPFGDRSCFLGPEPLIVSAQTFLSQLV